MPTDLELLINQLQSELDSLKEAINQCTSEMDFEGAQAFKSPFIYTREKLRILKCLQNPNHDKISRLEHRISFLENMDIEKHFESSFWKEEILERLKQSQKRRTLEQIQKSKEELDVLNSQKPKPWIENDTIPILIEELNKGYHNKLEFELIEDKIFLALTQQGNAIQMKIESHADANINHYLIKPAKKALRDLGFVENQYSKTISTNSNIDQHKILEVLSIITLEVFRLNEALTINVRLE